MLAWVGSCSWFTQGAQLTSRQFQRNGMSSCNRNNSLESCLITADLQNCIRLTDDLCALFDDGVFVFIPRSGISHVYFIKLSLHHGPNYHNKPSESLDVPAALLFAHFAWAILPLARSFSSTPGVLVREWNSKQSVWVDRPVPGEIPNPKIRARP